jgi:hypothetical protein
MEVFKLIIPGTILEVATEPQGGGKYYVIFRFYEDWY